ncbi:MAG: hypothetical protein ACSHXD_18505, partial [Marinosulfonomonas sp.]
VGKARSLSNGKWLKRAPGAARKRDRPKVYLMRNPETVEARIWALPEEKLGRIQSALTASMEKAEDISQLVIGMIGSHFFDELFSDGAVRSPDRLSNWFDSKTMQFGRSCRIS